MRTSESANVLKTAATAFGKSLEITIQSQARIRPYAPPQVLIRADSRAVLSSFARNVGISFQYPPSCHALLNASSSLDEQLASLDWRDLPELNWPRLDFDPSSLQFVRGSQHPGPMFLSAYQDPVRKSFVYRLRKDHVCAEVRADWGRWLLLRFQSRQVLRYQSELGLLAIPRNVRLPRLIARALTLCSGTVPCSSTDSSDHSDIGPTEVYSCVSPDFYSILASKLGQVGQPALL